MSRLFPAMLGGIMSYVGYQSAMANDYVSAVLLGAFALVAIACSLFDGLSKVG